MRSNGPNNKIFKLVCFWIKILLRRAPYRLIFLSISLACGPPPFTLRIRPFFTYYCSGAPGFHHVFVVFLMTVLPFRLALLCLLYLTENLFGSITRYSMFSSRDWGTPALGDQVLKLPAPAPPIICI